MSEEGRARGAHKNKADERMQQTRTQRPPAWLPPSHCAVWLRMVALALAPNGFNIGTPPVPRPRVHRARGGCSSR
jgi:hypothetical protein